MGSLYLVFTAIAAPASRSVTCVGGAYLCSNCLNSFRLKSVDDIVLWMASSAFIASGAVPRRCDLGMSLATSPYAKLTRGS